MRRPLGTDNNIYNINRQFTIYCLLYSQLTILKINQKLVTTEIKLYRLL